ncbi:MAG: immune inhibitor A [Anaerolineae bacterium]|nr:immune inhibitor A [Anaerolineae bacterium]
MRRRNAALFLIIAVTLAACAPRDALPAPSNGGGMQARIAPTATLGAPLAAPTPVAMAQPSSETADLLRTVEIPMRDRVALAQRFWGVGDIPRARTDPPPAYQVGATRDFVVDNTTSGQFTITAELMYATDHSYWWVEQGHSIDRAGLARSAERFEALTYPTTRRYFGSEWSPGVDNDPHVYILLANDIGAGVAGYFFSSSEYPREVAPDSNEAEIFLMSLPSAGAYIGSDYFDGIIAHEFQHMIHWAVDRNEDSWVNEGLSELSTLLNGLDPTGYIPVFMASPGTQLNTWPELDSTIPHYGAGHLFFVYMLERFGEEAIIQVVQEPANGMAGVEDALRAINATDPHTGAPVTAEDLFADWVIANYANSPSLGDGRYHYTRLGGLDTMPATHAHSAFPTYIHEREWPQYAADYIQLIGDGRVRFAFAGRQTVRLLDTEAHSGSYVFWGNRADDSDTTLTRAFDLTGVDRATLEYWTWYHIEALWDYAYVAVSTDGGLTWTVLETPHTTTQNPHNNAYGPGYTGASGGGGAPVWIQERIDLTPYAGQPILVRFEYVTDDSTLQPGIAIDDVAVPEIGYFEDFEAGDGGWESAGWVRHDNVLPQRFIVQMIEFNHDGTARAFRILNADDPPHRTWDIKLNDGVREVVVVVSGLAPVTTEMAVYTYAIEPVAE